MAGTIWVVGEVAAGRLARISTEVATAARALAKAGDADVVGVVAAAEPDAPAAELARFVPRVLAVAAPEAAGHLAGPAIAARLAALAAAAPATDGHATGGHATDGQPSYVLLGATPDGRDLAGTLSALLDWGVLVNAVGLSWEAGKPAVAMSVFGGKLETKSTFTGEHGIVTIRANAVAPAPLETAGSVERREVEPRELALATVEDRVAEEAAAVALEDARVIVAGGRGLGGPEGFEMAEELAGLLGGAVGATRAAVDAGWIPYARQIGQTGRIVKPSLYLALGISGAIQHKVGMQTAETIIAVNRDPEAPIGEFADMLVVGDVFEVVPELVAALRTRTG